MMFAVAVMATAAAIALPRVSSAVEDVRTSGAAHYLAGRLAQARVSAALRSADTALRIANDARGYVFAIYEDGNRNGVLTRDIQDGTDRIVGPPERLPEQFPGVEFGALPGTPGAEGGVAPGVDPIRLGAADGVTFTPDGTATPGSLYLKGKTGAQYVVRIYGESGRIRTLRYNAQTRTWLPR